MPAMRAAPARRRGDTPRHCPVSVTEPTSRSIDPSAPDAPDDAPAAPAPDARLRTLAEIHTAIWQQLALAAQDRSHAWRTPVLATADADGLPDARTLVLREVQPAARQLTLYTDARSAKVLQLQARPQGRLVCWSPALGWQLRIRLAMQVQDDGLAVTSRWVRLRASPAARDYLSPLPPGAPVGGAPPSPAGAQRHHFAVLQGLVQSIDWLELHAAGHRRACFDAAGDGVWLTP
ncbi:MAG: hypothetical protein RLY78_3806 [Pseudomonadota bacterium]